MKLQFTLSVLFLVSLPSLAGTIKSCKGELPYSNGTSETLPVEFNAWITDRGSSLGKIIEKYPNGHDFESVKPVFVFEEKIRAGIKIGGNTDGFNYSEIKILSAMIIEEYTAARSGIDLFAIRKVKLYSWGNAPREYSEKYVIEAYDENGTLLGSFFGGTQLAPCE